MLLLLNIAIQSALTLIVMTELTEPTYTEDTAAGYRAWRINQAHCYGLYSYGLHRHGPYSYDHKAI